MSPFDRQGQALFPAAGVPVRPVQDLRAALLSLNQTGQQYTVRDGSPEGVDLVADFHFADSVAFTLFGRRKACEEYQVWMRFDAATHQVHAMDHNASFTLTFTDPPRRRTTSVNRGQIHKKYVGYVWDRTPDGRRQRRESYRFDSADLKAALQHHTLTNGWSWLPTTRL